MAVEFRLPDIGEGIAEGEIVKWHVQVGSSVKEDEPLVEVMTDKVTAEIPSPYTGVVTELKAKEGEVVKVGSVIVVIEESGSKPASVAVAVQSSQEAEASPTNGKAQTPASVASTSSIPATPRAAGQKTLAAPATRRLARQLGIDLTLVTGSGPRGRVTPDDLRQFQGDGSIGSSKRALGPVVEREERVPFAGMRRKIAEHLVKSKQTAPHFAYVEEVDMTNLVSLRAQLQGDESLIQAGIKLNYLPFIIKAVIQGLKAYPVLNSSLDEATQEIVLKHYYNMGVAVATDQGLIVPVVKHAEHKSLIELAQEIKTLSERARTGKLSLDDLRGGTFTLTSIGSIGGLFGVPIINYPEVGIMGINKITQRPVVRDGQIVIRDMMHLSLSADHRVVDGSEAALFVKHVIEALENPARLLLS